MHYYVNEATSKIHIQVHYTTGNVWVGVGFHTMPTGMVGATAVIGSREGVWMYALGGKFPGAVTRLDDFWQTLESTSIETVNGVTILTFIKRLNENRPDVGRVSDQAVLVPNVRLGPNIDGSAYILFAAGGSFNTFPGFHSGGRDYQTIFLGLSHYTPPPSPPPSPPPYPPSPPPPSSAAASASAAASLLAAATTAADGLREWLHFEPREQQRPRPGFAARGSYDRHTVRVHVHAV